MSLVSWTSQSRFLHCRVCDEEGHGELIATVTALAEVDLPAVRCPTCESIQLRDEALDSSPTDASVDGYVEAGAGIGAIADSLSLADLSHVKRFLDVGCNYGFALDLGRFLFGWDVTGVEPSLAGRRGAKELGLDIRDEYLDESSQLGEPFDLILASEVVEHVPDPRGFLRAIAKRLAPGGVAVLTTPAAEIVDPSAAEAEVVAAISPGYHVFIASQQGLELLLRRAGFSDVRVERVGGSLRAVATTAGVLSPPSGPISMQRLEDYYRHAAGAAAPGSALELGMAVRHLRSLVARGDFSDVRRATTAVTKAFSRRHGLRLGRPTAVTAALSTTETAPPWSLAGAAFALGMIELSHRGKPAAAAEYFALAHTAARRWREAAQVADLDTVDLLFQSAYHRALAQARFAPAAAADSVLALGDWLEPSTANRSQVLARRECRVYVEIAARGALEAGGELEARADASSRALAASADAEDRMAGLDALLCLGVAALQRGEVEKARARLTECERLAGVTASEHGAAVARSCRMRLTELPPEMVLDPSVPIHSMIDTYWCDAFGTFVDGWVHAGETPIHSITVSVGAGEAVATRSPRPDLLAHWSDIADASTSGFAAYIPGVPGPEVVLTLSTPAGRATTRIALPAHPLPRAEGISASVTLIQHGLSLAGDGPVLAIGLRSPTAEVAASRLAEFAPRDVTSLDIHEGHGVTVVGDAHRMSTFLPAGSFSVVYSADVLEHLSTPWVFAAECARVLAVGGLAVHSAPWVWPTHASPNDFYRFSPEGLEQLFSPALGFRVVASGGTADARIYPDATWRGDFLRMPTTNSLSHSWIIAEKVSNAVDAVAWPYDAATGESSARAYPVDGLAATEDRS